MTHLTFAWLLLFGRTQTVRRRTVDWPCTPIDGTIVLHQLDGWGFSFPENRKNSSADVELRKQQSRMQAASRAERLIDAMFHIFRGAGFRGELAGCHRGLPALPICALYSWVAVDDWPAATLVRETKHWTLDVSRPPSWLLHFKARRFDAGSARSVWRPWGRQSMPPVATTIDL